MWSHLSRVDPKSKMSGVKRGHRVTTDMESPASRIAGERVNTLLLFEVTQCVIVCSGSCRELTQSGHAFPYVHNRKQQEEGGLTLLSLARGACPPTGPVKDEVKC